MAENRKFLVIEDEVLPLLDRDYKNTVGRRSTVQEMTKITRTDANAATVQVDVGREPYLVLRENLLFSMHPFVAVYDHMLECEAPGFVDVDTPSGLQRVPWNTLVVWL